MTMIPITSRRTTLAEMAYEQLRKSIVTLELHPGQMIYETEIAEALKVSRTPVREAIMLLKNEEMVNILPQKGVQVSLISHRKLNDAAFVRISLERCALEEVIQRWNSLDPAYRRVEAAVHQEIENQKMAIRHGDHFAFLESDVEFHKLLIGTLRNDKLMEIYTSMSDYLNRARYLEIMEERHAFNVIRQHGELLEAILLKDQARMSETFLNHVDRGQVNQYLANRFSSYFTD